MKSNASLGAYVIMYVVKNKKGDVIALLLKNGVVVPSNSNDMQIALVITEMLKNSKSFLRDFTKLSQSKDVIDSATSNMSGYSYMGGAYANADGLGYKFGQYSGLNLPSTSNTSTTSSSNNGFNYKPIDFGTDIFGTSTSDTSTSDTTSTSTNTKISGFEKYLTLGTGLFSDYLKMKDSQAKSELANSAVKVKELDSQTGTNTGGNNNDTKFNATPIYVVLGLVGLGLLGFLTYKMVKK